MSLSLNFANPNLPGHKYRSVDAYATQPRSAAATGTSPTQRWLDASTAPGNCAALLCLVTDLS